MNSGNYRFKGWILLKCAFLLNFPFSCFIKKPFSVNFSKIQQWVADNSDSQNIRAELKALRYNDERINAHLNEFKNAKYVKRHTNVFIFLAACAIPGFISCLLSLINPIPEMHNLFLYGLTSIATVIIFAGLYLLFE
jgi:hypothetical protein